ncbi:M23 family metallopeptidase [Methylobacterium nodulans]|uniref:Peptidase M23 n=1 Tax=Methylobacterium nodulans (strain LMG 21967 / CNCM I-2342 / ORS 2060) TaxID=460265 RepID=B8ID47_METNO|nr:M23 family metallopeptidase [Methylobacterium nodulans]ACL59439.1 Peptidase M23 [Methylobacterium nodulans ORS 2060]
MQAGASDSLDDTAFSRPGGQRVNLRWLAACLLTGFAGAGLLGVALDLAASNGIVAVPPELAVRPHPDGPTSDVARKGDRLVRDEVVVAAKREFRAPITESAGERELIRVHSVVQIATDLPLRAPGTPIPPFDPMRSARIEAAAVEEAGTDPAETAVTLVRSRLAESSDEQGPALTDEEVDALVAETQRIAGGSGPLPPAFPPERMLSRALRLGAGSEEVEAPSGAIEVKILPENLTEIPEILAAPAAPLFETREAVLGKDQTLDALLRENGAPPQRVAAILAALSPHARTDLPEGQHLRLLIAREGAEAGIARVTLYGESGIEEIAAANDRGAFVSVAPPRSGAAAAEDAEGGVSLYESLYGAGLKNGVPRTVIEDLVMALAAGSDLQSRTEPGDHIEIVFTTDEDARPELLYAALRSHGETQTLYRFRMPGSGEVEYLGAEGRSTRKFLIRRPVAEGRISSPFGARLHPILGYYRPHNGVDWAATRGTPIMATGDGVVISAGARSGYGNRVEIQHANNYVTAYNHMARIARGIVPGARVRLGQVIGAVGTTGLSTGPHVHYEVAINGRFVDPMKIRLPSARELTGPALAAFRAVEEQIDALRQHRGGTATAARS